MAIPVFEASRKVHINDLNDNCLLVVIDYVDSISDKNRMERVCKRWQNLVNQHWKSLSFFNFEKTFGDFYSPPLTTNTLTTIIKKCLNLKTIDLKGLTNHLDLSALDMISEACPNLETLIFPNSQVTDKNLFNLGKNCPNLKNLDLGSCRGYNEDGLSHLIKNCHQITNLNICNTYNITGNCFRFLSESLESLDLTDCRISVKGFVELAYRNRRNLKILKVSNLTAESHKIICSKFTSLKVLVIGSTLEKLEFGFTKNLKELEELECQMFKDNVTDDELIGVVKQCRKLRILMFPICSFSSRSIKLLPYYCANLKKLCFSFSSIDDETLNCLTDLNSLEWLDINNCQRITNLGILNLAKSCHKLGFLDLNNCFNITENVLEEISKFMKTLPDRKTLIICYKNNRINVKLFESLETEVNDSEDDEMFGVEEVDDEDREFLENDDPAMEADRELS